MSRSDSVVPDLSSSSERVSETVSTAMLSGTNCLDSSIDAMCAYPSCPGRGAASFTLLRGAGTHSRMTLHGPRIHGPRISSAPPARCAASGARAARLQCPRTEGIAGLHRTLLVAGHEPLFSLRGGTVGE